MSTVSFSLSDPIKSQGIKYYLYIDYFPISIQFDPSSEIQIHMHPCLLSPFGSLIGN